MAIFPYLCAENDLVEVGRWFKKALKRPLHNNSIQWSLIKKGKIICFIKLYSQQMALFQISENRMLDRNVFHTKLKKGFDMLEEISGVKRFELGLPMSICRVTGHPLASMSLKKGSKFPSSINFLVNLGEVSSLKNPFPTNACFITLISPAHLNAPGKSLRKLFKFVMIFPGTCKLGKVADRIK